MATETRVRRIAARVAVLLAALSLSTGAGAQTLNVPIVGQEQTNWCWDASSVAVLRYYGISAPSQCTIANWVRAGRGWGSDDCCTNGSGTVCNQGNVNNGTYGVAGVLGHWGIASTNYVGAALSQSAITSDIGQGRPFIIAWAWDSGGGHDLVGRGISGTTVYYMDPGAPGSYSSGLYSWVVKGGGHTWFESLEVTQNPPISCNGRSMSNYGTITVDPTVRRVSGSVTSSQGTYYTFSGTAGTVYNFTFCNNGGTANYDTWLCVLDGAGNLVTSNDDSCGLWSNISFTAGSSTTYRVAVSGYGSSAGTYTLAWWSGSGQTTSCNGRTAANAGSISPSTTAQTVSGSVTSTEGKYYSFSATAGVTYTFSFCDNGGTAGYDSWLCVLDSSGNTVASNDDYCSLRSRVSFTASSSSTYRIAVSGYSSSAGSYTLAYYR